MVRAQHVQASDPLVDVDAMIGNTLADVQVGGADGNVLSASLDDLAGIDADVDVTAAGNAIDVDAYVGAGTGIDVDGHVAVGDGIAVDADIGLDGALINAAANVDLGGLIGSGCGCGDSGGSTDAGAEFADGWILGPSPRMTGLPCIPVHTLAGEAGEDGADHLGGAHLADLGAVAARVDQPDQIGLEGGAVLEAQRELAVP